jgi:hypothetical protein
MRAYTFRYIDGTSKPSRTLHAKDDGEFYELLREFLGSDKQFVPGSIAYVETGKVADPPPHTGA